MKNHIVKKEDEEHFDDKNQNDYLIFKLEDIYYGTPLLDVREIIETQEYAKVPASNDSFLGMINLRGEIIGLVDLSLMLGVKLTKSRTNAFIVFETVSGPIAALVEKVISVDFIEQSAITDRNKGNYSDKDFLGIVKIQDKIVTLLNFSRFLEKLEWLWTQVYSDKVIKSGNETN